MIEPGRSASSRRGAPQGNGLPGRASAERHGHSAAQGPERLDTTKRVVRAARLAAPMSRILAHSPARLLDGRSTDGTASTNGSQRRSAPPLGSQRPILPRVTPPGRRQRCGAQCAYGSGDPQKGRRPPWANFCRGDSCSLRSLQCTETAPHVCLRLVVYLTRSERREIVRAAQQAHVSASPWVRTVALAALTNRTRRMRP